MDAIQAVWRRFAREGWSAAAAAKAMGVTEETARAEIARVRPVVAAQSVRAAVAAAKRSTWKYRG